MNPKPGDKVKIITDEGDKEGILMPNQETDSVVIKLDSGYNVGIDKNEVKEIQLIEKTTSDEKPKNAIKKDSKKPTISILHTGGTIASKVDYKSGAVSSSFTPEDLVEMFPEISEKANIESKLLSNMLSDDLRFKHFEKIAHAIDEEIKKDVKGIIIGMGTDNIAVAAAATSFAIENSSIPILFVGAQRSSDRGSSDAAANLICAVEFITQTDYAGVALCMHKGTSDTKCVILPGTKTRKLHTSRRDAFKAVNADPIATINYETKKITYNKNNNDVKKEYKILPKFEEKVGLLKIHVNMVPEQFSFYEGYKGLILEGTGLGHTPGQSPDDITQIHTKFYPAIQKVIDSGCIVVMTSQCIFGGVYMHVYSKGTDLTKLGVISGKDMLAETAFVKLSWLLGNHSLEEAKQKIAENLRGEINDRISAEQHL